MPVKLVIITGNEWRHRYFASEISGELEVLKVYFEQKANVHERFELGPGDKEILEAHFRLRDETEQRYFGGSQATSITPHQLIATGESNSEAIVAEIIKLAPDYLVLFGSSLIKEPLLTAFEGRVINVHLGLSPYYRGSGTNFWPLVHNKPECVGATIHLATQQVDAGAILQQVRPAFEKEDTVHDLGNKTIIAAAKILPAVIRAYSSGDIQAVAQAAGEGILCRRKDLEASAIKQLYKNFEEGMIAKYLTGERLRNEAYPIIEQVYPGK